MKPFDLERALAGDPVVTREGKEVRVMHVLLKDKYCPVVGYVDFGDKEAISLFTRDGRTGMHDDSALDLFMASTKHEGWINIYHSEDFISPYYTGKIIYDTEKGAKSGATSNCIAIVKIEWEE